MSSIPKNKRLEMPKLRKAAQGAECMMKLPDICNFDRDTVVLAHRERAGMGIKCGDYLAMNMCSACHDAYDRRSTSSYSRVQLEEWFDAIWPEQIEWWIRNGYLK